MLKTASIYHDIKTSLTQMYLQDDRPWLVGFSGGKDSTMLASLVFDAVLSVPPDQRKKPISVLCTDTRVEIPAIVEMVDGALRQMQRCSQQKDPKGMNQTRVLEIDFTLDKCINADRYVPSHARQGRGML
jgi:3'-phosphoadenosine 5'-phosphosulfate sulfotransferase (PAPS reductase)/FAD synthetase